MPVDPQTCRRAFQKLDRQLVRLSARVDADSVHKFRTSGRRVEALVRALEPLSRNGRKLLKQLGRLRKRAGKARDLEVHLSLLQGLKISREPRVKTLLVTMLLEERARCEKKLGKSFDDDTVRELQKRLKRTAKELRHWDGASTVELAARQLTQLSRNRGPVSEDLLHQYRVCGKRARYLAELEPQNPQARKMIESLKRMQDTIGDWHDWLKLTQRAEALLGMEGTAFVAALRNLAAAKFRLAVDALNETRNSLLTKIPSPTLAPAKKAAAAFAGQSQAAAA